MFWVMFERTTGLIKQVGQDDYLPRGDSLHGVIEADPGVRGYGEVDGVFQLSINFDAIRRPILRRIDEQANVARAAFVPDGIQAAVYGMKTLEAQAWTPGNDPATAPMLAAEAAAVGLSIDVLAQAVMANAALWTGVAAATEAARRKAKIDVEALGDDVLALAAMPPIDWVAVISGA